MISKTVALSESLLTFEPLLPPPSLCVVFKSSSTPAEDPLKLDECRLAGKYLLDLLKMDLKPRDIITPKSLRNAMVMVMALGGSTNAVLHLIAIAR